MSGEYLDRLFGLGGKVALVTGGATGIGYMMADALTRAGARVYIASRKLDACEAACERLAGNPGKSFALQADLSGEAGVASLAAALGEREDGLDILINNAGKVWGAPLEKFPWHAWESILSVNLAAVFTLTRELLPMLSRRAGAEDPARVVNVGSVVGLVPHGNASYSYAASKAAVHHLTRILANELAPRHITVNAIAPGPFPSGMMAFVTDHADRSAAVAKTVPLGRIGRADDIAALTLLLCGRGGSYLSGAVVPVDGGMSAERGPAMRLDGLQ